MMACMFEDLRVVGDGERGFLIGEFYLSFILNFVDVFCGRPINVFNFVGLVLAVIFGQIVSICIDSQLDRICGTIKMSKFRQFNILLNRNS